MNHNHSNHQNAADSVCPVCGMFNCSMPQHQIRQQADQRGTAHGQGDKPKEHHNHHKTADSHHDHSTAMGDPTMAKAMEAGMRRRFWVSFLLTIPIVLYSPLGQKILGLTLPAPLPVNSALPDGGVNWLLLILTTPIVFWTGSIFITGAYHSLKSKRLNMAVLIAVGVLAAYLFSLGLTLTGGPDSFFDAAAMLVTFVLFGHWMEMRSRRGTSDALRALFDLVPPQTVVIRGGKELILPTSEIIHGDIVLLKPGDKVPVDGEVIEGASAVDESLVTGESMPVEKKPGGRVIGGSVSQTGTLKFKATQVGSETFLAQIIKMVQTAQSSKAPGQRLADKAASWLVVLAVGSGLATFLGWYFAADAALLTALTFAISAVVIACPDALGLATPTAVAVGTGIGAKHNILIKDAATLENTSKINVIVLDKTGTLTEGKPAVTDIIALNGFGENEILAYEAALESKSNHPLAQAIVEAAKKRDVQPAGQPENFESIAGQGLKARINGKMVLVGTPKFLAANDIDLANGSTEISRLTQSGKTISLIAINDQLAGIVAAADAIKPSAKRAIADLKSMGLETIMITGDHKTVAETVGRELGLDRVFAEVLPANKAKWVKKLQDEGKFVAMVGDGINDAPALAQADIGIAIGAGTDVAKETGSIVLVKSDPHDIVAAIRLSRATNIKMKQNLFWAAIYNVLAIPVAAGVFYNSLGWQLRPEIAALLMSASSVIVATNAVLLKRVETKLKT